MSQCRYPGCEYDDSSHRPYARKRDGIPSASTIAGLLDTGKSRSFSWAASLIAATTAVHHKDQYAGLIGEMSDRALKNGHVSCTEDKDGLCKACAYLRSAFDRKWQGKADLGSHVHHLALSWSFGEVIDIDPVTNLYMDCLYDWYQQHSPIFLETEATVLYDKPKSHAYRGQFDAVVEIRCPTCLKPKFDYPRSEAIERKLHPRCKWLIDYKTGGFWAAEQTLQLAAYRYAQHITIWDDTGEHIDKDMPPVAHAGVLLLDPEYGGKLVELPASGEAHAVFLRMVDAFRFGKEMDKWEKEHPLNGEEPAA